MEEVNNNIWKIIDCYFRDNPQSLVRHHTESFNDFFKRDIFRIVKEMNPMKIVSKLDETSGDFMCTCNLYIGGKDGTRLYFAKPTIYDDNTGTNPPHYMFPNEARLRNMTYSMTIHYDVEVEVLNTLNSGELADLMKRGGNAVAEEVLDEHKFQNIKNDPEFLAKIEEKAKAANDDDIRDYKRGEEGLSVVVGGSGKAKNHQLNLYLSVSTLTSRNPLSAPIYKNQFHHREDFARSFSHNGSIRFLYFIRPLSRNAIQYG